MLYIYFLCFGSTWKHATWLCSMPKAILGISFYDYINHIAKIYPTINIIKRFSYFLFWCEIFNHYNLVPVWDQFRKWSLLKATNKIVVLHKNEADVSQIRLEMTSCVWIEFFHNLHKVLVWNYGVSFKAGISWGKR